MVILTIKLRSPTPAASTLNSVEDYTGHEHLRVGNGAGLNISSIGHASISTPSRSLALRNVLHVPSLSNSLISVKKFASDNNVFF